MQNYTRQYPTGSEIQYLLPQNLVLVKYKQVVVRIKLIGGDSLFTSNTNTIVNEFCKIILDNENCIPISKDILSINNKFCFS